MSNYTRLESASTVIFDSGESKPNNKPKSGESKPNNKPKSGESKPNNKPKSDGSSMSEFRKFQITSGITTAKSKPLRTTAQAAELLGFESKTLAQWRWQNKGPCYVKFGRSVRYPAEALEEFIAANTNARKGVSSDE